MSEDEKDRLLNLGDKLKARVIGQDDAVDTLSAALCRARCAHG
jgi:ATP-dependent Clp protease ATP-binding subunit ClpC